MSTEFADFVSHRADCKKNPKDGFFSAILDRTFCHAELSSVASKGALSFLITIVAVVANGFSGDSATGGSVGWKAGARGMTGGSGREGGVRLIFFLKSVPPGKIVGGDTKAVPDPMFFSIYSKRSSKSSADMNFFPRSMQPSSKVTRGDSLRFICSEQREMICR